MLTLAHPACLAPLYSVHAPTPADRAPPCPLPLRPGHAQKFLDLIEAVLALMRSIRNHRTSKVLLRHDAKLAVRLMHAVKAFVVAHPDVRASKVHDMLHYIYDWAMFGHDILRLSTGVVWAGSDAQCERLLCGIACRAGAASPWGLLGVAGALFTSSQPRSIPTPPPVHCRGG